MNYFKEEKIIPEEEKIYVVCGNYVEYVGYLLRNNLSGDKCVYVSDIHTLYGRRIKYCEFYGTYYKRRDINEIIKIVDILLALNKQNDKEFEKTWEKIFSDLQL